MNSCPSAPRGASKCIVEQKPAITSKQYEIGCHLVLITNKVSGLSIGTDTGDFE